MRHELRTEETRKDPVPGKRVADFPPVGVGSVENRRRLVTCKRDGDELAITSIKICQIGVVGKLFENLI